MKKLYYLFVFLIVFNTYDLYAENTILGSDIIEIPPGPFESEVAIRFEPDPEDWDNDGLKNVEEEKYGTDPNDPDTDNDGVTDLGEITNGTDPNSKNTTGYLEVVDLEANKKDVKSSEDIIDANDLSGKIDGIENIPPVPGAENDFLPIPWDDITDLPERINKTEPENTDEYNEIVPPDYINEEELSLSNDKATDSISKESVNDLEDEENDQRVMLNRTTSGKDLTPILMLLLLGDNDGDGMDDDWEIRYFGTLAYDADDDPDADNLSNLAEYNNHTDPNNPDSDLDGLTDGFEVLNGLNPNDTDTDDDSLTDGWEVVNGLNPNSSDTDNDLMPDGWEVQYGLNPLVNDAYGDSDNDVIGNYLEYFFHTDPTNPNSKPTTKSSYYVYDKLGRIKSIIRVY